MRQLVEDHLGPLQALRVRRRVAEDEAVVDGHGADVLHGTDVEFGHEELVVLGERVGLREQVGVVVEALLGDREQLVRVDRHLAGQRAPRVEAQRDALVLVAHHLVRAADQREQVGAEALRDAEAMAAAAVAGRLD